MCDTVFVAGDPLERGESLCRRLVMISMQGDPSIIVVLAVDDDGAHALASSFFSCAPRDVTKSMIDDVIAELLNMVAGHISNALPQRCTLGLPRWITLDDLGRKNLDFDDAILFRSEGRIDLGLWLLEEKPIWVEPPAHRSHRAQRAHRSHRH